MKNKLWFLQLPIILFFTFGFWVVELGTQGKLESALLREKVYPSMSRVSVFFTDMKFRLRGQQPPKNKIVIVEIDSPSIEALGRWPWPRNLQAMLIDRIFALQAKVVGLDIVYSEPEVTVPPELVEVMRQKNMGDRVAEFDHDSMFAGMIQRHRENLVLGWVSESVCQPLYGKAVEDCPVQHPDAIAMMPQGYDKFAYGQFVTPGGFNPLTTAMQSVPTLIANIPMFNEAALHAGYLNGFQDVDGYIRRNSLVMFINGKPYPSMALEVARVGLGEDLRLTLDQSQRVEKLEFAKSGRAIPVTPLGSLEANFRGKGFTFDYVSALDVLKEDEDKISDGPGRRLAGMPKTEVLKDAYVLVGLSAIGVFDMRAFPFDSNAPGVEIHANILDNLLSGDPILPGARGTGSIIVFLLMVAGAVVFGFYAQKLEAVPALILFLAAFAGIGIVDAQLLFRNNHNWNTGFLYIEVMTIFAFTLAAKYVMEENNKKFIKGAFAKYVSPALVDSMLKDPGKLRLGGEKKELTIMFSDIRSFTTFSERLDAKALAALLNDYLGTMTNIVFAHEGTLDKYIGDAIMAFWGAPIDSEKHAANAAKTARAMMKALAENKQKYKDTYGVDVNIGIGLNSGLVNVGNMGSDKNFAYTVIGDHVNLSSRLEGLTKEYRVSILCTRFTLDDIAKANEPLPPHRTLDHVKVKGKKQAVEMIQIFDIDSPNAEGLKSFEEGRALYAKQQWDAAIAKFHLSREQLAVGGVVDGPSELFIERCEEFKKNPPAADWDGGWEMHHK